MIFPSLTGTVFSSLTGTVLSSLARTVLTSWLIRKIKLKIVKFADRFWKSMPAALKRPTLEELYKRLRDLDYV